MLRFAWVFTALAFFYTTHARASDPEPKESQKRLFGAELRAELTKLQEVFSSVDQVPKKRMRWVNIRIGGADSQWEESGWLVSEGKGRILILFAGGTKRRHCDHCGCPV